MVCDNDRAHKASEPRARVVCHTAAMEGRSAAWRRRLPRGLRSKRVGLVLAASAALFAVFCISSALLFVFPATGMPARVNAIVVLGGSGNRLDLGEQLAQEGRAPFLVLSRGLGWIPPGVCGGHVGPAQVICFSPDPSTTQGEAEGAARIAAGHGWRSLALVTTTDQVWRAHLRFQRCYGGKIYGVAAQVPWYDWPYAVLHQWAGTVKAETYQRGC
jgi:uncharacterized SAM-binding protein YcdF (DUF218 family)